jgi:Fic family protein
MTWNWQLLDWPDFTWDAARLRTAEHTFLLGSGVLSGAIKHLSADDQEFLAVEAMSTEALTTSEIEGEILDRASVQSSIRRHLGIATDNRRIGPKEQGIAEVIVDLYQTAKIPLSQEMMFKWHRLVMSGIYFVRNPGAYRTDTEAMQIVSGNLGDPRVHFEAPPSVQVPAEMSRFITWFNNTAPEGAQSLPALTRAGIAHLYFESIHPFEDGNGRVGRAIAEKALAQTLGQAGFTALAATILSQRKKYYAALEAASTRNEITDWLVWFTGMAIEAQRRTLAQVEFLIDKAKLFDRLRGQLNPRQEKALLRMFQEGPNGFQGGMSAGKYAAITGASPATTTRDLVDLVSKEALRRDGEHKHARYQLTVPLRPGKIITINSQGELIEKE